MDSNAWVKQVLGGQQLKNLKMNQHVFEHEKIKSIYHTGHTPDIGSRVSITVTKNSLWGAVLTSLYIFREVLLGKGGISKVSNLDRD